MQDIYTCTKQNAQVASGGRPYKPCTEIGADAASFYIDSRCFLHNTKCQNFLVAVIFELKSWPRYLQKLFASKVKLSLPVNPFLRLVGHTNLH